MFSVLTRYSSLLSCYSVKSQQKLFLRNIGLLEKLRNRKPNPYLLDTSQYRLIYEFKYILLEAGFLRLKYSLPVLTLVAAPLSGLLSGSVSASIPVAAICLTQTGVIVALSKVLQNTVGMIYVHKEDRGKVLISCLDSSGRRVDRIHSVDKLVVCDFMNKLEQSLGFWRIKDPEEEVEYKIHVKNCVIHDGKAYSELFGIGSPGEEKGEKNKLTVSSKD